MSERATDPFADLNTPPGTVLQVVEGSDTYPVAGISSLDPRNAMSSVLAAFLRAAEFVRDGGNASSECFALKRVEPVWPDPKKEIKYPSASIVDSTGIPYEAHSLTPTALEETWDSFAPGTVLWKTAEAVATFQVDYWCTDDPTREAIGARLPSLFNPGEGRIGVVLAGESRYFRRPVRATLLNHERMDTQDAVFDRERRLMTLVQCEVDVVHLRKAVELQPRVRILEDTGDC